MSRIHEQNNDFSNATFKDEAIGINNNRAKIDKQTNKLIWNNKEINKIKKDFFDVRLKLNPLVCKILLALNFVLLIVSVIIFKLLKTDSCFELLTSSFMALVLSIVYYIFNKAYYKEYQTQNDEISTSDKFTVLFIIDMLMFGSLFWIYS